jgi:hypothetical protein
MDSPAECPFLNIPHEAVGNHWRQLRSLSHIVGLFVKLSAETEGRKRKVKAEEPYPDMLLKMSEVIMRKYLLPFLHSWDGARTSLYM